MTWSDAARRKSRAHDADEIARRAAAVRALKDELHKTHLKPEELDLVLDPVDCFRHRLRKKTGPGRATRAGSPPPLQDDG